MAKKCFLKIEFDGFAQLASELDRLGADLKEVVTDVMEQTAETIEYDTLNALSPGFLPAHGKYSGGDTAASLIRNAKPEWSGTVAEIHIGFNKLVAGAGGFLITGTPKMRPDRELNRIYRGKKYQAAIRKDMEQHMQDLIDERIGG